MRTIPVLFVLALALAGGPARADQNPVEPLSNGLKLTMTRADIQEKFGPPPETTYDPQSFGYKEFFVQCGGSRNSIWLVQLKNPVKLSSGIGVGSSKADVQRVFQSDAFAVSGQYALTLLYDTTGHVSELRIAPANGEFVAMDAPPPPSIPTLPAVVGKWFGLGSSIELFPDGTYKYALLARGTWHIESDGVAFDGPVAAWGKAHGKNGQLEFVWSDDQGPHVFTFRRE
jgi:hypothetical protein